MNNVVEKISKYKIVPVIAIDNPDHALPLADALSAGGLPLIEITFRTAAAAEVIATLRKHRPDMLVGAGTILTTANLKAAIDAGARFAVAPGLNTNITEEAQRNDFPFMPGIMTPTDIETGLSLGLQYFKFFPAEAAGGTKYLSSISAPYLHKNIKFIPTGGLNTSNLPEYLKMTSVMAVGGTWIARTATINSANWSDITFNCREALNIVNGK
jgi:2-dehydro-3-deoxyphosphogluconate aldolase/(4S)-4-hydroxy-2-oxoglutarate aldolase